MLRTGNKCIKDVTGYDLVHLLVGSEGTLAVITEVTVKLLPKPKAKRTALAIFEDIAQASHAVNDILLAGVLPSTLEIVDETAINCVEEYMNLGLDCTADAMLLVETDGDPESADREIEVVAEVCRQARSHKTSRSRATTTERDDLWRARRSISPSLGRVRPNKLGEDIVVPRSAIPSMVVRIKQISLKYDLPIVIFGHAGDGNLHPNILFDKRDAGRMGARRGCGGRPVCRRRRAGRHAERRARRWHAQKALPRNGPGAAGRRGDAEHQASPGSQGHPQPRQGLACLA